MAILNIIEHLSIVDDTRSDINQKHDLIDLIFLVISAIISKCEGWQDIEHHGEEKLGWLRRYRLFKHGSTTKIHLSTNGTPIIFNISTRLSESKNPYRVG
ncbi:hypothetical protein B6N13_23145 [Marinomonas sp. UCMA 3892]|nr:hypothetical protein [Marinomonas sp. UCMA 3892]